MVSKGTRWTPQPTRCDTIRPMRIIYVALLLAMTSCSGRPDTASESPAPGADNAAATATLVTGRAPTGALVSLDPIGSPSSLPDGPAIMDQFSKAFVPETLFVRVGQAVIFKNSEDQLHNVTVTRSRTGTGVFNVSQNQGDVHTHTFDQPGEYDVICDVHPGMRALLVATTTPYASYTDARGTFTFSNVPPGLYILRVLADGKSSERNVQISGAKLDLTER